MKLLLTGVAALTITTSAVLAGGLDRSGMPIDLLFEAGNTARLGFSSVTPSVSGTYSPTLTFLGKNSQTGNMGQNYATLSFALKGDFNDKLSYALIANQPFGADAKYAGGFYNGLEAHWTSQQLAALLKYDVTDKISVFGGLRIVTSTAKINIPLQMLSPPVPGIPFAIGPYAAKTKDDSKVGYLIGAAYEIPDIALRGSLTYQSAINHEFETSERFGGLNGGATLTSTTEIELPQSIALDFQTGIAKDTLLFGSVKWTEWSKWHVRPAYYETVTGGEVTGLENDVMTYQLGIGRRINDQISVFARVGYEQANGDVASRLAPTDGMQSIGLGGSWTNDRIKVTGGLEYVMLGDATDGSGTEFSGNSALGVGVSVDFKF